MKTLIKDCKTQSLSSKPSFSAPKKLMTLRNRGTILTGNFLHSKPKKQQRSLYRLERLQSSWFTGVTLQRARPKYSRQKQPACGQLQSMKQVSFTVCFDSYKLHLAWNHPSPISFKPAQPQTLSLDCSRVPEQPDALAMSQMVQCKPRSGKSLHSHWKLLFQGNIVRT